MSKQSPPGGPPNPLSFTPVALRPRVDGWTPERQVDFIQALAATGCVEEAAKSVGMTARSARALRVRRDADSLRTAWDAALATGIGRLAEVALSRCIHGTADPIFYKGEQIGERRRFDGRLTQFMLRNLAPDRYGAWRDRAVIQRDHPDGAALLLEKAIRRLVADCIADQVGRPRERREPLILEEDPDSPAAQARRDAAERKAQAEERRAAAEEFERYLASQGEGEACPPATVGSSADPEDSTADGTSGPSYEEDRAFAATGAEVTEVPPRLDAGPRADRATP